MDSNDWEQWETKQQHSIPEQKQTQRTQFLLGCWGALKEKPYFLSLEHLRLESFNYSSTERTFSHLVKVSPGVNPN